MSSWLSHKRCFDTVVESIDLVFEFCEEISHRLCVVVQFVQKSPLMFTNQKVSAIQGWIYKRIKYYMFTHSQVCFFPPPQTSVSKRFSSVHHHRVKTAHDVNKLFLVILADGYYYFSSVDRFLRIKQVAQRKTVREGRSRSVECCACTLTPGRVAQMSYLFSCREPALLYGTVSLQNFKICQKARHPWYPQKDLETNVSVCFEPYLFQKSQLWKLVLRNQRKAQVSKCSSQSFCPSLDSLQL